MICSWVFGYQPLGGEVDEWKTIEEAVMEKLTLLTLVENVFYNRNPSGPDELPCIVVEKLDETREDSFDGQASNIPYTFQFRVWTHAGQDSVQISRNIRNGLDSFRGVMCGRDVAWASYQGESDEVRNPNDGTERWVYGRFLNFLVIAKGD